MKVKNILMLLLAGGVVLAIVSWGIQDFGTRRVVSGLATGVPEYISLFNPEARLEYVAKHDPEADFWLKLIRAKRAGNRAEELRLLAEYEDWIEKNPESDFVMAHNYESLAKCYTIAEQWGKSELSFEKALRKMRGSEKDQEPDLLTRLFIRDVIASLMIVKNRQKKFDEVVQLGQREWPGFLALRREALQNGVNKDDRKEAIKIINTAATEYALALEKQGYLSEAEKLLNSQRRR